MAAERLDRAGVRTSPRYLVENRIERPKRTERIEGRPTEGADVAALKGQGQRRQRLRGRTYTVSLTITAELDDALHLAAMEAGCSRSSIMRTALLEYLARRER